MEFALTGISTSVALASVACLGYLIGRTQVRATLADARQRKLRDANQVIQEVQSISDDIRRSLASHHSNIAQFEQQIRAVSETSQPSTSDDTVTKVDTEQLLQPTMQMSGEIAAAYDRIRQQSSVLSQLRNEAKHPHEKIEHRTTVNH